MAGISQNFRSELAFVAPEFSLVRTNRQVERYYFPKMASDRRRLRIERLLDEAEEAIARYDWGAVRRAAQAVLAFDPENSEALDLLTGAKRALAIMPLHHPVTLPLLRLRLTPQTSPPASPMAGTSRSEF